MRFKHRYPKELTFYSSIRVKRLQIQVPFLFIMQNYIYYLKLDMLLYMKSQNENMKCCKNNSILKLIKCTVEVDTSVSGTKS